jgi:hypothetical protein
VRAPTPVAGLALLVAGAATAILAPGCAGDDRPSPPAARSAAPDRLGAELPAELDGFLDRAARAGTTAFSARYEVLRKLGPVRASVEVAADPPALRIEAGDVVVVTGPDPRTCDPSGCVDEVREDRLARVGLFSGSFTTGPAEALRTLARRPDAGEPTFTRRTVAGVDLECVAVPVGGTAPSTSCLTGEGVFGYVDTPAVRYALTRYAVGG